MTAAQRAALPSVLAALPERVLHGGAGGADEEFHLWLRNLMPPRGVPLPIEAILGRPHVEIYPTFMRYQSYWSTDSDLDRHDMAFATLTIRGPYTAPLERNKLMVERCDALLATPATAEEELRSGTWATIRYARKAGKLITIIEPDGTVREEKS